MTMTYEQAAALRKPFDPKTVGKLPKKQKNDDGSFRTVHLDFVGHAAVTDRLLTIDPAWTWEPLALTEQGLPAYDNAGGLWIRLTVCGVTRLGYGDGPDPKQRIGDALRNAAMRFGLALDLWSKQELEGVDPNGGDAAAASVNVAAHNEAQQQASEQPPDPDEAAAWFEAFRDHLVQGPENTTVGAVAQFYAKAIAAAAKRGVLTDPISDANGTVMTVRELIEQEQLRLGVAA